MRLTIVALLASLISCHGSPAAQAEDPGGDPAAGGQPTAQQPAADQGDTTPAEKPQVYTTYFNADHAWSYLRQQVDFGFRVPGTSAHLSCRRLLESELGKYCDEVELQEFYRQLPPDLDNVKMWNIIGRFKPDAERRILLAAHWDTRPTADMNPPGQRDQPIAGANDGASGVAVLLELARVFSEHEPPVGVDILLTDGEDYGPGFTTMFMGADYFANKLTINDVRAYNYGILLDMIGDKDLNIKPENNSEGVAGRLYAAAYEYSQALGYSGFKARGSNDIVDDHLPLINRGMRVYDFIDFDYPYWHTTEDTVDKCSRRSLENVGRVLENMVYLSPALYGPDDQKASQRYAR